MRTSYQPNVIPKTRHETVTGIQESIFCLQQIITFYASFTVSTLKPILCTIVVSVTLQAGFKQRYDFIHMKKLGLAEFIIAFTIYLLNHCLMVILAHLNLRKIQEAIACSWNIFVLSIFLLFAIRILLTPGTATILTMDLFTVTLIIWNILVLGIAVNLFPTPLIIQKTYIVIFLSIISFVLITLAKSSDIILCLWIDAFYEFLAICIPILRTHNFLHRVGINYSSFIITQKKLFLEKSNSFLLSEKNNKKECDKFREVKNDTPKKTEILTHCNESAKNTFKSISSKTISINSTDSKEHIKIPNYHYETKGNVKNYSKESRTNKDFPRHSIVGLSTLMSDSLSTIDHNYGLVALQKLQNRCIEYFQFGVQIRLTTLLFYILLIQVHIVRNNLCQGLNAFLVIGFSISLKEALIIFFNLRLPTKTLVLSLSYLIANSTFLVGKTFSIFVDI